MRKLYGTILVTAVLSLAANAADVSVDFSVETGKVKPLHGVNNSPGIFGDPAKRTFYRAFRDFNPLKDLGSGLRSGCFRSGAEKGAASRQIRRAWHGQE